MEFRKRHGTTDTTDFSSRQRAKDLLRTCYAEATGKLLSWILAFIVLILGIRYTWYLHSKL